MTYYYWNDIAMGNKENGFIQEEPEPIEPGQGFYFIGEGDCLQDALDDCRKSTRGWLLDSERMQAAIERDYE